MAADSASDGGPRAGQPPAPLTTHCATHPKVETALRCGKCGKPICPKCLVFTPVGARCRACADLRPLPMFQVGPAQYARAGAAGLGVGVIGGFLWLMIAAAVPFVGFWFALGMGYAAGEAISRATNRKRGRGLQAIAGATVLLGWVVVGIVGRLPALPLGVSGALAIAFGQIAVLFSNPLLLLVFALAVYIAVRRV